MKLVVTIFFVCFIIVSFARSNIFEDALEQDLLKYCTVNIKIKL